MVVVEPPASFVRARKDGDKALLEMDADLAELYESVEGCKFELNLERATKASPVG